MFSEHTRVRWTSDDYIQPLPVKAVCVNYPPSRNKRVLVD